MREGITHRPALQHDPILQPPRSSPYSTTLPCAELNGAPASRRSVGNDVRWPDAASPTRGRLGCARFLAFSCPSCQPGCLNRSFRTTHLTNILSDTHTAPYSQFSHLPSPIWHHAASSPSPPSAPEPDAHHAASSGSQRLFGCVRSHSARPPQEGEEEEVSSGFF